MKKNSLSYLLCFLFVLLLLFPDITKMGAEEGLSLWYHSVVPILFPFIILSNLMISNNSFSWFLGPLFKIKKIIPSINPWYFYALILGLFCGYPMGAKTVSDLIHTGKITVQEGRELLPVVNQASPMFLAGYLGIHIFNGKIPLNQILFLIYLPPLLSFLWIFFKSFFTFGKRSTSKRSSSYQYFPYEEMSFSKNNRETTQKNSMPLSMEHTIWDSFFIIVTIGVYMMIFTIFMHLIELLLPDSILLSVLTCFLEFSAGLNKLNSIQTLPVTLKNSLLLCLTSFGGLCTSAQTYSIIENTGIRLKSYLLKKGILALLVFLLSYASLGSS